MKTSISIVIPAKNEKSNIIVVLRKIAQYVKNDFECLIVVDDLFDETINAVNSLK
jgi:glycosyltransferase involved in cell wall biosynthesis